MSRLLTLVPVLLFVMCGWALPLRAQDKLDYKQRDLLKDARFYIDQAEGLVARIEKDSAEWKAGDSAVPIQKVEASLAQRERAAQHLKNALARFDKLPIENADVATEAKRYNEVKKRLAAAEKKVVEVHAGLAKGIKHGADGGGGFKADIERLKEINQMFANIGIIRSDPDQAAEVFKQMAPMKQERQRIGQKYDALLKQNTPEAQQMKRMLAYSDGIFAQFEKAAAQFVQEAPAEIDKSIAEAIKLAEQGFAEKKPAFFGEEGGVRQRLRWAEQRLAGLQAADPKSDEAKQAAEKIKSAQAKIAEMAQSLKETIIEANRVPDERYNGPDAAALRQIVKQKWEKEGNGAEILKVGLNGQNWRRETRWEWSRANKAFEKVDKSRTQGFVLVKHPGDRAAVHYVNLVKDHLARDTVTAYFLDSPKDGPEPGRLVLMRNLK